MLEGNGDATTTQSVPVPVAIAFPAPLGTRASNTAKVRASATRDNASTAAHSLSGKEVCNRKLIVLGEMGPEPGRSPILTAFLKPTVAMHRTESSLRSHRFSTNSASEQPVR